MVEAKLEKATSTYAANLKKVNEGTVSGGVFHKVGLYFLNLIAYIPNCFLCQ